MVAPIILGSGRTGFSLPPIARVDEAILTPMRMHRLGDDVLFDCDLSAQREPVGVAKKST
jgi:diaminohydroxyphosphoribosylaminopyrimidine deaminase/5-amino-6-(5-phosphoribosylamino)uracil reductase